ncbi:CTB family bacteriocin [Sphaerospermopsis sp. FACHB-1194]|uniref:CTB family bacteriocin n=1 Tax=Sphaerospermopsis sp. FACHB-1194 TaxID=2692862 RepID=UPI0016807E47|nr:CTB family bacteriocin [Sphaerospermopsis sp. FACHB-1194]MBD2145529.1 hypothetical protein [Sphaerospermopsis sp. FACHB-1194]
MANLFTAVSAEQQEIVAGGRLNLDDLIETAFSLEAIGFDTNVGANDTGSSVSQMFGANETNSIATKKLNVQELPNGGGGGQ